MSKGYKWIIAERESLDPHVDYERIWELSTCYYVNDFMMNFLYTVSNPYFILTPQGSQALYRGGTGKTVMQTGKRESDTVDHFWKWYEYGPSNPVTQESVSRVNAIHQGVAKKYTGLFSHLEDYTYTICWIGADVHRMRLRVGLNGYTEKQKIATHLYWQEMAKLFRGENDTAISDFPTSFDGMLEYLAEYEARDWPHTDEGALTCVALLEQFSNKWFPRGFRYFGRAMILSLLGEAPHRVHRLPYPNIVIRKLMEWGYAGIIFSKEHILPDPKISTPEKHRRAQAATQSLRSVAA